MANNTIHLGLSPHGELCYAPQLAKYLLKIVDQTLILDLVADGKTVGFIPVCYLMCLDFFKNYPRFEGITDPSQDQQREQLIFPEGTGQFAQVFIEFLKAIHHGKMKEEDVSYNDFVGIVYLSDYFQMNDEFVEMFKRIIGYYTMSENWVLLGKFIEFYGNRQYDQLARYFTSTIAESLVNCHCDMENLPTVFFNTVRGRRALVKYLESNKSSNKHLPILVARIVALHVTDQSVTLKGVYELVSLVDWFNVSFELADKFLHQMNKDYPEFHAPKRMVTTRKQKESLIKAFNHKSEIFAFKEGISTGHCQYVWDLGDVSWPHSRREMQVSTPKKIKLYTTDAKSMNCSFEAVFGKMRPKNSKGPYRSYNVPEKKPILRINNRSGTKNLHVCVSVIGLEVNNAKIAKPIEIRKKWHWDFTGKPHDDLFVPLDQEFTKCQLIFHEVFVSEKKGTAPTVTARFAVPDYDSGSDSDY